MPVGSLHVITPHWRIVTGDSQVISERNSAGTPGLAGELVLLGRESLTASAARGLENPRRELVCGSSYYKEAHKLQGTKM